MLCDSVHSAHVGLVFQSKFLIAAGQLPELLPRICLTSIASNPQVGLYCFQSFAGTVSYGLSMVSIFTAELSGILNINSSGQQCLSTLVPSSFG